MKTSGSLAPCVARALSTWSTMMSRNDLPSRTGSSDLALSMPIEVPRPPLSLMITVLASAAEASASLTATSASRSGSVSGSMESSAMKPVTPSSSWR